MRTLWNSPLAWLLVLLLALVITLMPGLNPAFAKPHWHQPEGQAEHLRAIESRILQVCDKSQTGFDRGDLGLADMAACLQQASSGTVALLGDKNAAGEITRAFLLHARGDGALQNHCGTGYTELLAVVLTDETRDNRRQGFAYGWRRDFRGCRYSETAETDALQRKAESTAYVVAYAVSSTWAGRDLRITGPDLAVGPAGTRYWRGLTRRDIADNPSNFHQSSRFPYDRTGQEVPWAERARLLAERMRSIRAAVEQRWP